MPRLVRVEGNGPIKIEPQEKAVWICACGLSQNLPHCDGSHTGCSRETPGMVAVYDETRTEIVEEREEHGGGA